MPKDFTKTEYMTANHYYTNLAYPLTYFAADSTDGTSVNTYMTVKDAYKSTLNDLGVGFTIPSTNTFKGKFS